MEYKTLVLSKTTKDIYEVLPNDWYINLSSGKSGRISPTDASKYFKVGLVLQSMVMQNENLVSLIKVLGLRYDGFEGSGTEDELKKVISNL